jgi:hypothetical protein
VVDEAGLPHRASARFPDFRLASAQVWKSRYEPLMADNQQYSTERTRGEPRLARFQDKMPLRSTVEKDVSFRK